MKILVVKLSAMGDVIHALPAISQAKSQGATLHWLVDERFAVIPSWHAGVSRIIPIPLRKWKNAPWSHRHEMVKFIHDLRQEEYDRVIDLQGLFKSGLLARLARGERFGPHGDWIREKLATPFYQHTVNVQPTDHVIVRLQKVMAAALGQEGISPDWDFGLQKSALANALTPALLSVVEQLGEGFFLFLHGAAWSSKLWPLAYWQELLDLLTSRKLTIGLPWGNLQEKERAIQLAEGGKGKAIVLPALSVAEMATLIARARGVVGLDSGFAHLAAALTTPVVTLFGATNPDYSGIQAGHQLFLRSSLPCAPCMQRRCDRSSQPSPPCFAEITPARVVEQLYRLGVLP
ncbi:MAG: lipopolysaccharide heptosyltransferase I [Magnetococcales bacterium]|nr:lipopolysaccharide heptosyltransferase I [Magnetococcales bacterium]NGZ28179.1 lipopolysaccharide heptosyltransferase I [Magnetococcales bacterium]